jgi:hypothetical protein
MAANLSDDKNSSSASKKTQIPALTGSDSEDAPSITEMAEYLRNKRGNKISEDN